MPRWPIVLAWTLAFVSALLCVVAHLRLEEGVDGGHVEGGRDGQGIPGATSIGCDPRQQAGDEPGECKGQGGGQSHALLKAGIPSGRNPQSRMALRGCVYRGMRPPPGAPPSMAWLRSVAPRLPRRNAKNTESLATSVLLVFSGGQPNFFR